MTIVATEQLSKKFRRGPVALCDCSLEFASGQCSVVVGPSGCGKTTLLRLIAGLETPDSGVIRIGERRVNDVPPHDRDVAMVFQDFSLYPHLRLRRNLTFAPAIRGMQRSELHRRVEQVAAILGITHLLDRKPAEMSGGERQRAAVGRVLVRQPACALFDEPFSNLDAKMRRQLRRDWKFLQSEIATTSIFVTHDQEEAMSLADQLIVMANGRVQQVGPPLDVYRQPTNRFVAGFIGSPPMNFISGVIESRGDGVTFRHPEFALSLNDLPAKLAGQKVVLGIRPEHLETVPPDAATLAARAMMIEPLGSICYVHCETPGGLQFVLTTHSVIHVGETLHVRPASEELHFFEHGEFGRAL